MSLTGGPCNCILAAGKWTGGTPPLTSLSLSFSFGGRAGGWAVGVANFHQAKEGERGREGGGKGKKMRE